MIYQLHAWKCWFKISTYELAWLGQATIGFRISHYEGGRDENSIHFEVQ